MHDEPVAVAVDLATDSQLVSPLHHTFSSGKLRGCGRRVPQLRGRGPRRSTRGVGGSRPRWIVPRVRHGRWARGRFGTSPSSASPRCSGDRRRGIRRCPHEPGLNQPDSFDTFIVGTSSGHSSNWAGLRHATTRFRRSGNATSARRRASETLGLTRLDGSEGRSPFAFPHSDVPPECRNAHSYKDMYMQQQSGARCSVRTPCGLRLTDVRRIIPTIPAAPRYVPRRRRKCSVATIDQCCRRA